MPRRLKLAVLISGGGTTLKNLIQQQAEGRLACDFSRVISGNPRAGGIDHARAANIPCSVVRRRDHGSAEDFRDAVFEPCRADGVDLVVMGGFLKHVLIPDDFQHRVVNIHPALIPAFCGQGYYGLRVHRAVLDYGAKVTGCTVHFVDNQYDHGPIILQRVVAVREHDTPESLARRVFAVECEAYPDALRLIADNRVTVHGRVVRVER